jgi:predicted histidine transporter YuiF (NhaC family)
MRSLYLTTARFCVAAWVGAAVLFVITSVSEVTSDYKSMTSDIENILATIRFPPYYVMGFLLVTIGTVSCGLYLKHPHGRSKRMGICMMLLILALITMLVDYVFVYLPLVEMITPPERAKPAGFSSYHNASKYINAFDVGLCLIAALLLCLPKRLEKK